jgi:hypothetical protein
MAKPSADVDKVEEQLSRLLIVLQRDGYLLESGMAVRLPLLPASRILARRHGQ